ncbi:FecR family protein [Sulfurisoma sediminicola]|uniref:FecR family protein n=2 Tax=Sulfurisoma sediminicola TaxID=1381557 RepID=A0A497XKK3_9PROT|nr:FecR family protein [Sulfurisoma sediminicola]
MKLLNSTMTKVSLALLLAWGTAAQAEVAGRVLVSVGDNAALRAGKEIKLAAGSPIETGDTLRVGDASNLQVRFTDEAIMALRPNSTVRIDDYAFANKTESDKSIFSLLKGGLRTITGIIGRNSRNNYAVKAETATIGIRGTHFTLVHCNNDCRNPDGSTGQNGTFGGVTDGRISVSNDAGASEFGKNEFFFVAGKNFLPEGLISPPGFLRDRLAGQARNRGKDKAAAGPGSESGGTGGGTGTSTQPGVSGSSTVFTTNPTGTDFVPAEQQGVASSLTGGISFAFVGSYAGYWTNGAMTQDSAGTDGYQIVLNGSLSEFEPDGAMAAAAALGTSLKDLFLKPYTVSYTWNDSYYGTVNSTVTKGAAVEVGTDSAANLTWGRTLIEFSDVYSTWSETGKEWDHFVFGDAVTALPTSGNYLYNWVGGTSPTDQTLTVGTLTSGGSINVKFDAGHINMQTVTPIAWSMPNTGSAYLLTFSGSTTPSTSTYTSGTSSVTVTTYSELTPGATHTTCSNCEGSANSYVRPQFMGSNAQALGLGISTYASGMSSLSNQLMSSAQVYKR